MNIRPQQKNNFKNYKSIVDIGEGRNRQYILHSLKLASYDRVNFNKTAEVRDRIMQYFTECCEEDMRPSVAGLALCLGCSRDYVYALANGELRAKTTPGLQQLMIQAIQILDTQMMDYMQHNDINPIAGIFIMKNNFGYRDEKNISITNTPEITESKDKKSLEQKYLQSIADDLTVPNQTEEEKKKGRTAAEDSFENSDPFVQPIHADVVTDSDESS